MTTSQTQFLSEIVSGERIPDGKQSYFRTRLKNSFHDVVLTQFADLNINKADLARRLGKEPAQITRWLGSPGNWTLDTLSDILLGMGCEPQLFINDLLLEMEKATRKEVRAQSTLPDAQLKNTVARSYTIGKTPTLGQGSILPFGTNANTQEIANTGAL